MFKKRAVDKKVDLSRDIEDIEVSKQGSRIKLEDVPKSQHSKQIHKQALKQAANQKRQAKKVIPYGLIEKDDIFPDPQPAPQQQNMLINMYIQKRLNELNAKETKVEPDNIVSDILQMQKQYMSVSESKIAEYDVKEIQKKLEKLAVEAIRSETANRNAYLKDLLENEYERMEYASKKELKLLRQDRERTEKELISKYKDQGRRHYVDQLKNSLTFDGS